MSDMPEWVKDFFINVVGTCSGVVRAWIDEKVMGYDPVMSHYHRELIRIRRLAQSDSLNRPYPQRVGQLKAQYKKKYPEWWDENGHLLNEGKFQ